MAELSTIGGEKMIAADPGGAVVGPGAGRLSAAWDASQSRFWWWSLGAVALVLALTYAPNLRELVDTWSRDPNYSHGYLVVPIALFVLWRRLGETPWERARDGEAAPWWSWVALAIVLAIRVAAYERSYEWVENATLLPVIVILTWTFGGTSLLLRAWPAILFLIFMLPLPRAINGLISLPLQRIAATGSNLLLQLSGFWVIQEGNVLNLQTARMEMRPLDVALACNGLKMLMCLAATVTATIMMISLPTWKRIALLISAVPIAMISNMIRIVTTGWCYYYIEGERAHQWAHDISGWLMMPLALVLVGLELQVLSWLIPEEDEEQKPIVPLLATGKKAAAKPGARDPRDELA